MVDEALGTALLSGRAARRAAGLAFAPARAVWRSPLGAPGRAFTGRARHVGLEARREFARLVEAAAADLAEALPALVERIAASGVAARTLDAALTSPLPLRAVDGILDAGVVERAVDRLLADRLAERVVDQLLGEGLAERVVDQLVAGGVIDQVVGAATTGDLLERTVRELLGGSLPGVVAVEAADLVEEAADDPRAAELIVRVLGSPAVEALIVQVLESEATITLTEQILRSAEMQRVLETIASSPEIRQAVAEQSAGLASDVTAGVRERSVRLDDAAEQAVRGIFRRNR